jgi:hypothetical protein
MTLLARRAATYFSDFGEQPCEVIPVHRSRRVYSSLAEFALRQGSLERRVIVKSPQKSLATEDGAEGKLREMHPRLHPRAITPDKGKWEFHALRSIEEHFTQLGDERFGAVRALELVPPDDLIVMEKYEAANLRRLLFAPKLSRVRQLPAGAGPLCRTVGQWLREFHQIPPSPWVTEIPGQRSYYEAGLAQCAEFMARTTGRIRYFEDVQRRLSQLMATQVPTTLPVAVLHGDFAPRNVFVKRTGTISVCDTMAFVRASIYVDLAHFCVALHTAGIQAATLGLWYSPAQIVSLETALLEGYFASDTSHVGCVRVFTALALLERWGALQQRVLESRGTSRWVRSMRFAVSSRHFRNCLARLLHPWEC